MKLYDYALQLCDGNKRQWQNTPDFVQQAVYNPHFDMSIVGSFSLYSPKDRISYCCHIPGWIDLPIPPTAIGRKSLEEGIRQTGKRKIESNKNSDFLSEMSHPLFFTPYAGQATYIDLKSAYWQVYSKLPIHFFFNGEVFSGGNDYIYDCLPEDWGDYKLARNSLAGIFNCKNISRIRNAAIKREAVKTPCFSPSHWGFIQCFLHWIANRALDCGAVYIYTDGYIFPDNSRMDDFLNFLNEFGIEWGIKGQGASAVTGIGRYVIGSQSTKSNSTTVPLLKVSKTVNMEKNWSKLFDRFLKLHSLKNNETQHVDRRARKSEGVPF